MSLFKSREWWATVVGEEEQFDLGCLCLANIDNSATGTGNGFQLQLIVLTNTFTTPSLVLFRTLLMFRVVKL